MDAVFIEDYKRFVSNLIDFFILRIEDRDLDHRVADQYMIILVASHETA